MRIEVLCTGDELLTGLTSDTNSRFFMERLELLGAQVSYEQIVGDVLEDIVRALREAATRADVLLVSGGLGPTMDDLTAEAAATAAGVKLIEHAQTWEAIVARFNARGLEVTPNNRRQAQVPEGCEVVKNPAGSAPMFVLKIGRCALMFVPGVPREYKALVELEVLPRISAMLEANPSRVFRASRLLKTMLLPESHMDQRVRPLFAAHPSVRFGTRTHAPENHLKLLAEGATREEALNRLHAAEEASRAAVGRDVFGTDDERYVDVLIRELRAAGKTVAVAESCTGGLVQQWLTSAAGASAAFNSGVVAYSEEVKTQWVGVPRELIAKHGVVSADVAKALAEGIRRKTNADYGIGVTGFAGPSGGTEKDPVGTVYVALATATQTGCERMVQTGDRDRIRLYAVAQVLELLRHEVRTALGTELRFISAQGPLYRQELELRFKVLREPLGQTRADVVFPFDPQSLHLVAMKGAAVNGCVLFHPEDKTSGRLFQMAVEPSAQRSGIGAKLVRALESELIRRGFNSVHLHARETVVGFYERLGYQLYGEPFVEAGVAHRYMRKLIA